MTREEFTKLALKAAKQKHYHRLGEVPPNCVRCADFASGASFGFDQGAKAVIEMLRDPRAKHSTFRHGRVEHLDDTNHIGPSLMAAFLWADWVEAQLAEREAGGAKSD